MGKRVFLFALAIVFTGIGCKVLAQDQPEEHKIKGSLFKNLEVMSREEFEAAFKSIEDFKPKEISETDSEIRKLKIERYNFAWEETRFCLAAFSSGSVDVHYLFAAIDRISVAALDLETDPVKRIGEFEKHVLLKKMVLRAAKNQYEVGRIAAQDVYRGAYELRHFQIKLLEAKENLKHKGIDE